MCKRIANAYAKIISTAVAMGHFPLTWSLLSLAHLLTLQLSDFFLSTQCFCIGVFKIMSKLSIHES